MPLRILIVCLLFSTVSFSQNEVQNNWNRIFAKHYTSAQLESTFENSPEIYSAINYYFKESFGFVMTDCQACPVDIDELINNKIFDVYEHESLRLDVDNYSFAYKDYTITLFPKSIVYPQLDGLLPSEIISYIAPRDFPTFALTNDDNVEYADYTKRVYAWAKDFPEQYRTMTNSENLLKISIRDFALMGESRKAVVLNNAGGYLIID